MSERQPFFFDPAIPRKSGHVDTAFSLGDSRVPLPSVVEISESGTCNRKCAFCPRSAPDYPDRKEFVDPGLVDKLSSQLGSAGFRGIFLFSGFVEPLLDKNIFDLIALVRRNIPKGRVEMVTNGDALNDSRLVKLFESGLSTLLISVYDSKEDADRLQALCENAELRPDQFVIRHRYLPQDQGFGITLTNRAGMMSGAAYPIAALDSPMPHPCYYPHYTFFMDYQGDVLLCPHDWGKKLVVGNMTHEDFWDIWTSPAARAARTRLNAGDRGFAPCDKCDVKGIFMGAQHAKAWADFESGSGKE